MAKIMADTNKIPKIDMININICLNCERIVCNGCMSYQEGKKIERKIDFVKGTGAEIRAKRLAKNLKIRDIAELTGIPKSTIGNYERGVTSIPYDKLKKINAVLSEV